MVYLGIIAATGITIYYYWRTLPEISRFRRYLLAVLRVIALSIVMILLFNPVIHYTIKLEQKPQQIILLDNSASMQETSEGVTKYDLFEKTAQDISELLTKKGYSTRIINFANGINGENTSSRLAVSLAELQDNDLLENTNEIFMLSDGWFDDSDPGFVQNIRLPINVNLQEFNPTGFDLEISRLKYNQRAWLKELNSFIVDVSAENYAGTAEVDIYLENEKIESRTIDFSQENYQQLLFEYEFMDTGLQKLRFSIYTDSLQEMSSENNHFPGAVLVLKDKAEILVISDKLTWEGRFLVQAASREERFDVRFLPKERVLKEGRDVVELGSAMENCQVLCLINNGNLNFDAGQVEIIDRYVSNGGGILCMGKPVTSIEYLLPAASTAISRQFESQFHLTLDSETYQSFEPIKADQDEIPPVRFFYTKPKLSAEIMAEFRVEQTPPAIIFHQYANGKVLYFSFLDLWKWQMWGEDNHYQEFVSGILQWLSYAQSESFFSWSEQNNYLQGEEAIIHLNAFDEKYAPIKDLQAAITIKLDGKEIFKDYLLKKDDSYEYSFIPEKTGKYDYIITDDMRAQSSSGSFIVNSASSEVRDRGINTALLTYLAEQTGGRVFDKAEGLQNFKVAEINQIEKYYEIPIYKKWYTIALFLLAFCLEIFFRKRWGLL